MLLHVLSEIGAQGEETFFFFKVVVGGGTRQLLCPRALPRNVTQCREQLPGLSGPEGQGWQ